MFTSSGIDTGNPPIQPITHLSVSHHLLVTLTPSFLDKDVHVWHIYIMCGVDNNML